MSDSDFPPASLRPIAAELAELLKSKDQSVAVAETAAGGLVSATLLAQPGASKYYRGGLTLYTLPSRVAFAGWTQANIDAYKGPTPDIVSGLAEHTRQTLGATYALSESGTAGPTGGSTPNRTPGYVALAVAGPEATVTREWNSGHGKRDENMIEFAREALTLLRDVVTGSAKPGSKV